MIDFGGNGTSPLVIEKYQYRVPGENNPTKVIGRTKALHETEIHFSVLKLGWETKVMENNIFSMNHYANLFVSNRCVVNCDIPDKTILWSADLIKNKLKIL